MGREGLADVLGDGRPIIGLERKHQRHVGRDDGSVRIVTAAQGLDAGEVSARGFQGSDDQERHGVAS